MKKSVAIVFEKNLRKKTDKDKLISLFLKQQRLNNFFSHFQLSLFHEICVHYAQQVDA
jgi:hypothetical protein